VVGILQAEGNRWVVVADQLGRLRVESPSMFSGEGMAIVGNIDGQTVTRWSGTMEKMPTAQPGAAK
jgi:zona occludens toxin